MKAGLLVDGWETHEAGNGHARFAAHPNEPVGLRRHNAGFLGFLAGVHLDEEFELPLLLSHFLDDHVRELRPVDRMDGVE